MCSPHYSELLLYRFGEYRHSSANFKGRKLGVTGGGGLLCLCFVRVHMDGWVLGLLLHNECVCLVGRRSITVTAWALVQALGCHDLRPASVVTAVHCKKCHHCSSIIESTYTHVHTIRDWAEQEMADWVFFTKPRLKHGLRVCRRQE